MAGGSLLGSLFASWTGDRIGRRDTLGAGCIVFMVGAVIMCAVQNQAMLIASRVISGFAVGMLTSQGYVFTRLKGCANPTVDRFTLPK